MAATDAGVAMDVGREEEGKMMTRGQRQHQDDKTMMTTRRK
jgi:hypothetical protein